MRYVVEVKGYCQVYEFEDKAKAQAFIEEMNQKYPKFELELNEVTK